MNKTITDYEDVKCYMQFHDLREAILAVERFTEMYKVRALTCVYMGFFVVVVVGYSLLRTIPGCH